VTASFLGVPVIGNSRETLLGFQPTLWYYTPGITDADTLSSVAVVLDTLRAGPFIVAQETVFDRLGFRVISGVAGSLLRAAVYRSTRTAIGVVYPGAIVPGTDTGDLSGATSVSNVEGAFTPGPIVLQAGLYWLAWNASVVISSVLMSGILQNAFGRSDQGANPHSIWSIADAYANFPRAVFPDGATPLNSQAAPAIRVSPI
jgi:hypothetical protein